MEFAESISAQELEQLETVAFEGPIGVIAERDEEFAEAVEYLRRQPVLGFDTETKPCFESRAPRNPMAILQLSGKEKAYVFKLQVLGLPQPLMEILADPDIVKVGAACGDDVRGLQHYGKFVPRNFVDLQKMSDGFGIRDNSVKKMAGIILNVRISKAQQLSNWEAVQLSGAQLKYAATDAWICLEMYERLMAAGEEALRPLPPQQPAAEAVLPVAERLTLFEVLERAMVSGERSKKRKTHPAKPVPAEGKPKKKRRHKRKRKRNPSADAPETVTE